jgi:transposase InsO family protein
VRDFRGEKQENGKRWIDDFLRCARCYGWTAAEMLDNAAVCLQDHARTWYENGESAFTEWAIFEDCFRASFANDERRRNDATELLRTRSQVAGESCEQYDFTIVHKSGRKHLDADALSRAPVDGEASKGEGVLCSVSPVIFSDSTLTAEDFVSAQLDDNSLGPVIRHLTGTSLPNAEHHARLKRKWERLYVYDQGLLYRRSFGPLEDPLRLAVPRVLQARLVEYFHDSPTAGHLGFAKTYHRIARSFHWKGMQRHVSHYVRSCTSCQRHKGSPSTAATPVQSIPPPLRPFECIGIDFVGPFPRTVDGNKYILVSVDYLTRYAETMASPKADARTVSRFYLERVVLRHGVPLKLISDRGQAFLAKMVAEVFRLCGTIHCKTTSYHPQTNGLTERFNRTLGSMLSMYVDECHANWDLVLPFVTYAYNTAI